MILRIKNKSNSLYDISNGMNMSVINFKRINFKLSIKVNDLNDGRY
jgi:hypothetical protein